MQNIIKHLKNLYSSSQFLQKIAKIITSSWPYFFFTQKFINIKIKIDLKGPFNLLIETTNYCNAKCLMCPHRFMKRPQKLMSDKIFNTILDRIQKENLPINKIYLSGFGEPFTDPSFLKRVGELKKLNLPISFYTNASLLTTEISQKLIDLKIDEINISFNAITKESYHKIMQLDFEKTKKNILNLIKLKGKNQKPFIRISSVINKQNEKDIKIHLDFWQNKANLVTVTQAHEWGGAVKNKSSHQFIKNQRVYPCRSLWHTFALDSKGNFVLCCRDYESKYILGNIQTHSFRQIQNSILLRKIKSQHLKYQKNELPTICQNCNFPFQDGVEWFLQKSLS